MSKFEQIKSFYDKGYWTKEMVQNAVKKQWITEKELKEILK